MKRWLLAGLLLLAFGRGAAQDTTVITDGFRRVDGPSTRKTLSTILLGLTIVTTTYDDYNVWWKGADKPFSFFNEQWLEGGQRGLDKVGHFFGTYAYFKSIRNLMLWGGYSKSKATFWACGLALWNGLRIEIGDGFSPYGFDYQDLTFDMAGVAYGLLQTEIPVLQNFNWKFSYWSAKGIASPANFTNDYDALKIWLTANVHNLLPQTWRPYWPEFIQLAVGYGVDQGFHTREFIFGLDFNFSAFDTGNEDILFAQKMVELFHIPAPAVKFESGQAPEYYLFFVK